MGALTSKPYAFNARSWELQRFSGVDFLDGFGSSIYVDVRGTRVVRIVPRVNELLNEEWIPDKIRFFYDGVARQRVGFPMFCDRSRRNRIFVKLSWSKSFKLLQTKLIENFGFVTFLLGSLVDLNSMSALKQFLISLGTNFTGLYSGLKTSGNVDFRSSYLFPSGLDNLERSHNVFLIGCLPRLESPIFNMRLLRASKKLGFTLYVMGSSLDLTYSGISNYRCIGKNISGLVHDLVFGRSLLIRNLLNASKYSLFVLGSQVYQFEGILQPLLSAVRSIVLQLNKTVATSSFVSLYSTPFVANASELRMPLNPLAGGYFAKKNRNGLLINILEENERYDASNFNFVTSLMTNGEVNATASDLVLPSAHPFEYDSKYIGNFGNLDINRVNVLKPFMESKTISNIFLLIRNFYNSKELIFFSFFEKTYCLRSWMVNMDEILSSCIFFNYYRFVYSSSDLMLDLMGKSIKPCNFEVPGFLKVSDYSKYISSIDFIPLRPVNMDFIPFYNYQYYLSDSFVRVSKSLSLAQQRFKLLEIYS